MENTCRTKAETETEKHDTGTQNRCSFDNPNVDYYIEPAEVQFAEEEADSRIDPDFTRLYLRDGNAWIMIRFAEREEEGSEDWKRIRTYCLERPFAGRMFREAHQRSFRKHGINSEAFIEEIRQFLRHFSFEAGIYDHQKKKNYIEDLLDQAAAHPDRTAVVDRSGERSTTYAEFVSLIKKTAAKIQSFSLPGNSFIIINMGRCREYLASMYAIVYAGHALIPLVPETPKEREEYIRNEAESPLTIREDFFDDIDAWPESEGVKRGDKDPALMLYTSGSTGRPKGVWYAFKPLSNCYQHSGFILEDIDPIIYASSIAYSFAAIAVDTFHVFCFGGTLHILSEEARKDVKLMNAYYRKHGITVGNVHPRLHKLLDGGDQLKRIFTSGHRITDFYSDRFQTILGYGLAETFSVPTHFLLDKAYATTPAGKSYGGYTVIVCDENGREVNDGERGEVRIAGALAEGYFKMPELTARTFEKQADGTVLLHTHDIGYKDENGDLILVNRDDWLVKISGMSVNPAEIDFAMSQIPGIKESAAKGFTDANGNSYICDFYVTEDASLTPKVLREILARSLMPYMIPSVFARMDALPQTISSKVDYTALKVPERTDGYEAPEDPLEKRIAAAFETVIGRGRIGRKDDFFEAGGDSLSLIELLVKLDDTSLSIADITEYRTVERIAAYLKKRKEAKKEQVREDEVFPLTPYQAHYIRACESAGAITMGNAPSCIRMDRNFYDEEAVKAAFRKVIQAHPALRSVIFRSEEGVRMRFAKEPDLEIETVDLPSEPAEETLQACIRPFALFDSSLVRAKLFRTPENLDLFFDVHHIVSDFLSTGILTRDLFAAMRNEELKKDLYPEYLFGMKKKTESGEIAALQNELLNQYDGYVRHPQFDDSEAAWHTDLLRRQVLLKPERMKTCSDGRRAGVQAGLSAACLLALHKDTGKDRVLSGWLYNGRDSAEKMNMAGLMISSLTASADFSAVKTAEALLDAVRLDMRESLRTAEASPGSLLGGLFEEDLITVNYTAYVKEEPLSNAERITLLNRNTANTCIFYVILNENEDRSGELLFKYNDSVYSKEHIERFITYFFEAVQELSLDASWLEEVKP